jgi:PTH1 family peptidyl-tRNA hydrolase
MYLVVGLGNPGKEYAETRHNLGFLALDALAARLGADPFREKFSGEIARARLAGEDTLLLRPLTYMNLSGQCVQPAAAFHKVNVGEIVVLHDELDLPFGEVRLKLGGGHAGHNGLRSLIERLGSPNFLRVRIGIGRPPAGFRGDVASYVLGRLEGVERAEAPDLCSRSAAVVVDLATHGLTATMNRYNVKPKPAKAPKAPAASPAVSVASPAAAPAVSKGSSGVG